jgi:hypothetical protein
MTQKKTAQEMEKTMETLIPRFILNTLIKMHFVSHFNVLINSELFI